ncbi:hypothetical protein [Hymenobacter psoromatis]|uniref:hypothetical protein n=1 Tax=Hymenobacter psoromatis TaxID=1484116 RepID=UPI001CBC846C|nr:hypothetical protein [Hymenobacter psoromatis]
MKYHPPIYFQEDNYLDELIQQKFTTSLMSDSKWVRLIAALVTNHAEIKQCLVKPIWDEEEPTRELLFDENTYYDFDYYATAMESMVSGKPRGWYAYKEIEWLDFPHLITSCKTKATLMQDLEVIQKVLDDTGQFALERTSDNLRLYAYFK